MFTISDICFLIFSLLILCVPEEFVWLTFACIAAYFILPFLCAIWTVLYDFFRKRPDTEEDLLRKKLKKAKKDSDFYSVRIIEWKLLPSFTKERFVAYYKTNRKLLLLDTLCSDVSKDFKDMARIELEELEHKYNTNTPPEEWDPSQNVEYLF